MTAAIRRRNESDLVLLEVIRLTSAASWNRHGAARALLAKGHTPAALRLAYVRVLRARVRTVSGIDDRAAATLTEALALREQGDDTRGRTGAEGERAAHTRGGMRG